MHRIHDNILGSFVGNRRRSVRLKTDEEKCRNNDDSDQREREGIRRNSLTLPLTDRIAMRQQLNIIFLDIFVQFFRNRTADTQIDLIRIRFVLEHERDDRSIRSRNEDFSTNFRRITEIG